MKKNISYIIIILLLLVSIKNVYEFVQKKIEYNEIQSEYGEVESTYKESELQSEQLEINKNKERYFREHYNVSKKGEILFKFPEENYEDTSS